MARLTLLLAHATSAFKPKYAASLGEDVRFVPWIAPPIPGVDGGGLSSRYVEMARKLRAGGQLLGPLLLYLFGRDHEVEDEPLIVGGYSAGFAMVRELAASPADRARIAGWLLIDGGHAALDADGSASDAGVAWLAELCRDAAAGRAVLCYGCSDVDPVSYASTAKTILEALRLAGLSLPATREICSGCRLGSCVVMAEGGLRVEAHDHRPDPVMEHRDALTTWGPALAARTVAMVLERPLERSGQIEGSDRGKANDSASSARSSTLGEHALAVAIRELDVGAREEPPGSNTGPRVLAYLAGCVRDERLLMLRSGAWCAAFVGYCDSLARLELRQEGIAARAPCRWRAAVWELVADARAAGAWREADETSPLPGDLAVFRRAGGDPRRPGQEGHVGRVEAAPDAAGRYLTIEGNVEHRVARVEHRLGEDALVGWIAYARAPSAPSYHVETSDIAAGAAAVGLDRSARDLLKDG